MAIESSLTSLLFPLLVLLTMLQRLTELTRSRTNRSTLEAASFVSVDSALSYTAMVAVHSFWLIAMLLEHHFAPWSLPKVLALAALFVFIGAQALRFSVMRALGYQWNTRVMTPNVQDSDLKVVASGPYRYVRHPNYLAVIIEFISLPLVGGAVVTAVVGTIANIFVLKHRVSIEERSLFARSGYAELFGNLPRFVPRLIKR